MMTENEIDALVKERVDAFVDGINKDCTKSRIKIDAPTRAAFHALGIHNMDRLAAAVEDRSIVKQPKIGYSRMCRIFDLLELPKRTPWEPFGKWNVRGSELTDKKAQMCADLGPLVSMLANMKDLDSISRGELRTLSMSMTMLGTTEAIKLRSSTARNVRNIMRKVVFGHDSPQAKDYGV